MRKAMNENPVVQAVVIGVLLVFGAVMLMTRMGGSDSGANTATTSASTTVTGPTGATADVTASTDGSSTSVTATVTPASGATAAPVAAAAPLGPFEAGPGLPHKVFAGYESGRTVVLYVYDPKGIEDGDVLGAVNGLKGDSSLAVFTVEDKDVAQYARITQGVGLSQVPALIVISPGQGGAGPKATVSYGFRGEGGVTQAVRDAVYKGKTLGYDPG
jgi:hypothetical protein